MDHCKYVLSPFQYSKLGWASTTKGCPGASTCLNPVLIVRTEKLISYYNEIDSGDSTKFFRQMMSSVRTEKLIVLNIILYK